MNRFPMKTTCVEALKVVLFLLTVCLTSNGLANESLSKRYKNFGLTIEDLYSYELDQDESTQSLQQQLVISNNLFAHYFSEYARYDFAKEVYNKLLSDTISQVTKGNVLRTLAMLEAESNQIQPALDHVNAALSTSEKDIESLVLKSQLLLAKSESEKDRTKIDALLEEALKALETAKDLQTSNTMIYESLGKVYLAQQNIPKLLDCYRSIAQIAPRDLNYRIILANLLLRTDNPKEAIKHLEDIVSQRRSYIQGYILLAEANLQLYQPRAALKCVKDALLIDSNNSNLQKLFDTCSTMISKSGKQAAIQQYEKFADDYPHAMAIQKLYAMKLEETKQPFEKILEQWQKVLSADPDNTTNLLHFASLYFDTKDYPKALEYVKQSLAIDGADYKALVLAVKVLTELKNTSEAYELIEKAIRLNPGDGSNYFLLAKLQESDGRTTESKNTIIAGANSANPNPEILAAYGEILSKDGDTTKAQEIFTKALASDSLNISIVLRYHEFLLRKGDTNGASNFVESTAVKVTNNKVEYWGIMTDSAIECYQFENACAYAQKSLEITPNQPLLIVKLISMWSMMSEYDKCIDFLKSSHGRDYLSDLSMTLMLASAYWSNNQHDEARNELSNYLRNHSDNLVPIWQLQLDFALDDGNKKKANRVISEVEQSLGKDSVDVLILKAYYHMKYKDHKQTLAILQQATKTQGASEKQQSLVYYLLGCTYSDLDMINEAEESFKKSIEIYPENESALNGLGYLWADHGINLDEAEKLIDKALKYSPLSPHIIDSKGWVLYKKNQCESAMIWLNRAAQYSLKNDDELLGHIDIVSECLKKTPKE